MAVERVWETRAPIPTTTMVVHEPCNFCVAGRIETGAWCACCEGTGVYPSTVPAFRLTREGFEALAERAHAADRLLAALVRRAFLPVKPCPPQSPRCACWTRRASTRAAILPNRHPAPAP